MPEIKLYSYLFINYIYRILFQNGLDGFPLYRYVHYVQLIYPTVQICPLCTANKSTCTAMYNFVQLIYPPVQPWLVSCTCRISSCTVSYTAVYTVQSPVQLFTVNGTCRICICTVSCTAVYRINVTCKVSCCTVFYTDMYNKCNLYSKLLYSYVL